MSELAEIRDMIYAMDKKLDNHITETRAYRESQSKVVDAHSKSLWGNGEPGLEKKVDRLEQAEGNRKKWFWAVWTAIAAGIVDRFTHIIPK